MSTTRENISFKDLLLKLKYWVSYLLSKWLTIGAFCILAAAAGFAWAYFKQPTYAADITFVLSSGTKAGGLAALAGQLGYDVGGSAEDIFAGDNIIELFKSNRIVKEALFRKIPGTSETVISALIKEEELDKSWGKRPELQNALPLPDSTKKLTPVQDSLVAEIHQIILKKYLSIGKPDKKLSIYSVSVTSTSQPISYYLSKYILDEASVFYIDTKTKTSKLNLNMLQHEADSLRLLLGNSITSTAGATDKVFNLNPAYQVQRSTAQQGQVSITVLSTAYGEVVKNLELAKITLLKETPLYQVIDEPNTLLKRTKSSKLLTGISFAFVTALCVMVFLVLKKSFRES